MFGKIELIGFPADVMILIFSYEIFEMRDILLLSLVCKRWNALTKDNKIWRQLHIRDFSYDPYLSETVRFFKQGYQNQFFSIKNRRIGCLVAHHCGERPRLRQAVETQNLPEVSILLNSSHCLYIEDFSNPGANLLNIDPLLFEAEVDWSTLQRFLVSSCSILPKALFVKLMSSHIRSLDLNNCTPLLLLVSCYADEESLRVIFKTLGDELLAIGQIRNYELLNFVTILYKFPVERLDLVLRVLVDTLGEEKLSQFLTYQSTYTRCGFTQLLNRVRLEIKPTYNQPMYLLHEERLCYYDNFSKAALEIHITEADREKLKELFSGRPHVDQLSDEELNLITKLTRKTPYKRFISSCVHQAMYNNKELAYFVSLVRYIQRKDAYIFLQEGYKYGELPLFYFAQQGYRQLMVKVFGLWEDNTPKHLEHRNSFGNDIVDCIFSKPNNFDVRELTMNTMCGGGREFLSIWGKHILQHVTFSRYYNINILREVLELLQQHHCFSIAEEFYMNEEFWTAFKNRKHRFITPPQDSEVYELLTEFELVSSVWSCNIQ